MSESQSQTTSDSQEKAIKHAVADTLGDSKHAVAVVEKQVGDDTVENYYISLDDGFAEILPANPRAKRIKRFTLCQRIENLPESASVSVVAQTQLDRKTQRHIGEKLAPLRKEDKENRDQPKRKQKTSAPKQPDKLEKHVQDDPSEVLDIASAPAGTSEEHGGGW